MRFILEEEPRVSKHQRRTSRDHDIQEIRDPEREEGTDVLLFMVSKVQELEDVGVPWLYVDSESTRMLVTALVDATSCRIEGAKHGHNTVQITVSTSDVSTMKTPTPRKGTHH